MATEKQLDPVFIQIINEMQPPGISDIDTNELYRMVVKNQVRIDLVLRLVHEASKIVDDPPKNWLDRAVECQKSGDRDLLVEALLEPQRVQKLLIITSLLHGWARMGEISSKDGEISSMDDIIDTIVSEPEFEEGAEDAIISRIQKIVADGDAEAIIEMIRTTTMSMKSRLLRRIRGRNDG